MPGLMAMLGLDGSSFKAGLKSAETVAQKAGEHIAGFFSVAVAEEAVRRTIEFAASIKDASLQYQITTEEVQKLTHAAMLSGLAFEDVGSKIAKLGHARREAAEGNDELRAMFLKYGITLDDLQNPAKRNIDLLKQMGEAMQHLNLTAREQEDLREFFGRGGERLGQLIKDLNESDGIHFISNDQIEKLDHADKIFKRFGTVGKIETANVMQEVWEFLTDWKTGLKIVTGYEIVAPTIYALERLKEYFSPQASEHKASEVVPGFGPLYEEKKKKDEAREMAEHFSRIGILTTENQRIGAFANLTSAQDAMLATAQRSEAHLANIEADLKTRQPPDRLISGGMLQGERVLF